MNKLAKLLAIFIIGFSASLNAQFGAHAGASLGNTTYKGFVHLVNESNSFNQDVRFTGGVFYRYQIKESKFAIQTELNWLKKGGKGSIKAKSSPFDWEYDFNLNYLEVPVYFLYSDAGRSGFYGGIGPSFNFGLAAKQKVTITTIGMPPGSFEEELKFGKNEDLRCFHLGINAMAGYQVRNGVTLNAFLSQSITNSAPEYEKNGKVSFLNYGLRAGYMFNAGGKGKSDRHINPDL